MKKFLTGILLGVGFILALIALIVTSVWFFNSEKEDSLSYILEMANITFAVFSFLLSGFIIYLIFKLIIGNLSFFGKYTYSRIISFGLVSVLYFKAIKALIILPVFSLAIFSINSLLANLHTSSSGYITTILYSIPEYYGIQDSNETYDIAYSDGYNDGYDDGYNDGESLNLNEANINGMPAVTPPDQNYEIPDSSNVNTLIDKIIGLFYKWCQSFLNIFSHLLKVFGAQNYYQHGIAGLLLLYIIGLISDQYLRLHEEGRAKEKLQKLFEFIKSRQTSILFIIIFVISGFLTLSSIIAIPVLKEGESEKGVDFETFKKNIEEQYENSTLDFPVDTSFRDQLDKLTGHRNALIALKKDLITKKDTGSLSSYEEEAMSKINLIKGNLDRAITNFRLDIRQLKKAIQDFKPEVNNKKNTILSAYEANQNQVTIGSERVNYYNNLKKYLEDYTYNYKSFLSRKAQILNLTILNNTSEFEILANSVEEIRKIVKNEKTNGGLIDIPYFNVPIERFDFEYYAPLPQLRENLDLGPFGFLANWLIETRSNEMALIAGMIGFGLLGAGIASFIRDRSKITNTLFKNNISSTLIGGISASLIVFLTAKGGVTIISTQEIELNQYTLLFLCLVGSVFSETIWEKAYKYINNQDTPNDNETPTVTTPPVSNLPDSNSQGGDTDNTGINKPGK